MEYPPEVRLEVYDAIIDGKYELPVLGNPFGILKRQEVSYAVNRGHGESFIDDLHPVMAVIRTRVAGGQKDSQETG